MNTRPADQNHYAGTGSPERRPLLLWFVLSTLAALLAWFGFRGYLSPELLFHFANSLYC